MNAERLHPYAINIYPIKIFTIGYIPCLPKPSILPVKKGSEAPASCKIMLAIYLVTWKVLSNIQSLNNGAGLSNQFTSKTGILLHWP